MQFLKTLFWVVLAVAAVVFAMRNWVPVTVSLWGGLLVEAKLPVLIYGAFLAGLLPTLGWHHVARWRLLRRIESQERALGELRPMPTPVAAVPRPGALVEPADDVGAPAAPSPSTIEPTAQS